MNLFLNGELTVAPEPWTVAECLERLGLGRQGVAVELNRQIVPKSAYNATALRDGDRIEIVQFVGGG